MEGQCAKEKTRHKKHVFGLGSAITSDDEVITGSRLPTAMQVLRCMMYHRNVAVKWKRPGCIGAPSKHASAKVVLQQITSFYKKANIPMVTEKRACDKIIKLLNDNKKLRAVKKDRRENQSTQKKLAEHSRMLNSTFKLWPPGVEKMIKNAEDLAFLESMKGDRTSSFGSFDKALAQKVARRRQREAAAEERIKKSQMECTASTSTAVSAESFTDGGEDINSAAENDSDFESYVDNVAVKKKKLAGTPVFIPSNVLSSQNMVSLATRLKMTPTQQAAFTKGLITECGGDVSKVAASYATADRSRRKVVSDIAADIHKEWIPPNLCTLHWDGKMISTLTNPSMSEERLAVLVGDKSEMKLLGVPSYKKEADQSVGGIIADTSFKLTTEWNCNNNIVNMAFDTTSSNTGHLSAACIAIQDRLDRSLLWSGCRHHIGEVLLTHVFNGLKIEVSKSPDVNVFSRLRKNWDLLPHTSELAREFQPSDHPAEAQQLLEIMRQQTIDFATEAIEYVRDDYHEFTQLSLVFLGAIDGNVQFRRPGAVHKARWMAKLIYSIKLALSEPSIALLPRGTITTPQQVPKIRAFVTFITHVYCIWWLSSNKAIDAPWNDLKLFQALLKYEVVNREISQSATQALSRHLWYLTEEMIPLSLFSTKVPQLERQELAQRLLEVKPDEPLRTPVNRFGSGWGKPKFPANISLTTRLCDLVGVDSWFTFHCLQLDDSFLALPVSEWNTNEAYMSSADNIAAINVVNDGAERGVKIATDFADAARSDEHFQNVLQVVEQDRKANPNLRINKIK